MRAEPYCCTNSLLQLLARQGFVPEDLAEHVSKRKEVCSACRVHLQQHPDERLRPRVLTDLGDVADAFPWEHERAYVQHDVHGEVIVRWITIIEMVTHRGGL